jgi:hypothetical protein
MRDELFCIRRSAAHTRVLGSSVGRTPTNGVSEKGDRASEQIPKVDLYELSLGPETFVRESFAITTKECAKNVVKSRIRRYCCRSKGIRRENQIFSLRLN